METHLRGRTALVTGAGTGIGRAIAIGLGREGANVVVNYNRSEKEVNQVVSEIEQHGAEAIAVQADVTQWRSVGAMFDAARSRFGTVDILINNAGGNIEKHDTHEIPEEVWDKTIALNLKSVFLCCKAAIPQLPDGYGRIITISSISGYSGGGKGGVAYGAAKAGVITMTRGMAHELAPRGITVNGIAPGVIKTLQHERFSPPDVFQQLLTRIPLNRHGQVEDLVGIALLLASDAGSYITGETIQVNGGMLMN